LGIQRFKPFVALSTSEAEFIAAVEAGKEDLLDAQHLKGIWIQD